MIGNIKNDKYGLKIIKEDIRKLWKLGEIVCVTINGYIKKDGSAVMGRGNALAMADMIPELPHRLGEYLKTAGLKVGFFYERIIAFPVKPKSCPIDHALADVRYLYINSSSVPGYHCKASVELISKSAKELVELAKTMADKNIYLPLPGIGNGGLSIQDIFSSISVLYEASNIVLVKFTK
jgi:hypothetical protein